MTRGRAMTRAARRRRRWLVVVVFAAAMAWVEAASVFYIRALTDRIEPYQANPLPIQGVLGGVELVREAATLVMLVTLGMLAARNWVERIGYTAIAFGVWDILYYVFLRPMTGWPRSLLDWDVLFLLPLPWWGPVLAPVSIAALMILWGTLVTQSDRRALRTSWTWTTAGSIGLGIALALYVFMADALGVVSEGLDATTRVLPARFNWTLFCTALGLMTLPVAAMGWRLVTTQVDSPSTVDHRLTAASRPPV